MKIKSPLPIFDSKQFLDENILQNSDKMLYSEEDFNHAKAFLKSYDGSEATFNAYRREIERLIHWSWLYQRYYIGEQTIEYLQRLVNKEPCGRVTAGTETEPKSNNDGVSIVEYDYALFSFYTA